MCSSAAEPMNASLVSLGWTDYGWITIYAGLGTFSCFGIVLIAMHVSSYAYTVES